MANSKDLYKKVKGDVATHHIFSKDDQSQLADIIKQLGQKPTSAAKELAQNVEQTKNTGQEEVKLPLKEREISDEEIIFLLDRLNEFDLEEMETNSSVYDVYMEKLKVYQKFDNYKKIIKQEKYHRVLVAHLDYLSSKVIEHEHQSDLKNALGRV